MRPGFQRWAVFISGRGSNLAALIDCADELDLALVVSSRRTAYGLDRARRAGIPTLLLPCVAKTSAKADWMALDRELRARQISHIFLLGFMKIVPEAFVTLWSGRILNLHPSLLPSYPGLESIRRAHEAGDEIGVTVHQVTAAVDAGAIVAQRRSLNRSEANEYSLETAEFLVHRDEQRLVREAIRRWRRAPMR